MLGTTVIIVRREFLRQTIFIDVKRATLTCVESVALANPITYLLLLLDILEELVLLKFFVINVGEAYRVHSGIAQLIVIGTSAKSALIDFYSRANYVILS